MQFYLRAVLDIYIIFISCIVTNFLLAVKDFDLSIIGYSSLVLDSSCTQLFASCTDDIVYQYNLLSLDPKPGINLFLN